MKSESTTKKLTEKRARRIVAFYILLCISILIVTSIAKLTFPKIGPGYSLAMIAFILVCCYWVLLLLVSRAGFGLRAYVHALYSAETQQKLDDVDYHSKLVKKLSETRGTCATFASLTFGIIAIAAGLSIGAKSVDFGVQVIVGVAAFLLVIGAIVLIHAVDACDTAMNPQVDRSTLEEIRHLIMNYYAIGSYCLVGAVLMSISIINPYLSASASIFYMAFVWHYFFFWKWH
jgi:hypothetical protein